MGMWNSFLFVVVFIKSNWIAIIYILFLFLIKTI